MQLITEGGDDVHDHDSSCAIVKRMNEREREREKEREVERERERKSRRNERKKMAKEEKMQGR